MKRTHAIITVAAFAFMGCAPTAEPERPDCGLLGQPCPGGFTCTEMPLSIPTNNIREYCASADSRSVFVPSDELWYGVGRWWGPLATESSDWVGSAPVHPPIELKTRPFVMHRAPATFADYHGCMEAGACDAAGYDTEIVYADIREHEDFLAFAAHGLGWKDAHDYCAWEAERSGQAWRLCSDIEFEMAGAGGCGTLGAEIERFQGSGTCLAAQREIPWGQIGLGCGTVDMAKCRDFPFKTKPTPLEAGYFHWSASVYGVIDMLGSFEMWVQDCGHTPGDISGVDPTRAWDFDCTTFDFGDVQGTGHLVRGRRFNDLGKPAGVPTSIVKDIRYSYTAPPGTRGPGVRCCRDF